MEDKIVKFKVRGKTKTRILAKEALALKKLESTNVLQEVMLPKHWTQVHGQLNVSKMVEWDFVPQSYRSC